MLCVTVPLFICLCMFGTLSNGNGRGDGEFIMAITICTFGIGWFISRVGFSIFFWNILTMTSDEREKIEANKEDLKYLETLKLCSDIYSSVDSNRIVVDMRKAQHTLDWINYAVWAMLISITIEVLMIVPTGLLRESAR